MAAFIFIRNGIVSAKVIDLSFFICYNPFPLTRIDEGNYRKNDNVENRNLSPHESIETSPNNP